MKKTTTATATATTLTVTKQGKRVAKSALLPTTKQEKPLISFPVRKPYPLCASLWDYIESNNIPHAIAKGYCNKLEGKGNATASDIGRGYNLPFSIEDLEGLARLALWEVWTGYTKKEQTDYLKSIESEQKPDLPNDMVLQAYITMGSGDDGAEKPVNGMYRQATRLYKWLYVSIYTDDDHEQAINLSNIDGWVNSISDYHTRLDYDSLLSELDYLEKYVLRRRLEGYTHTQIVNRYATSKRMTTATANNRIRTVERTLQAKAKAHGINP